MTTSTLDIIKSVLKNDPTLNPADISRIVGVMQAPKQEADQEPEKPRILRRSEVAKRLSVSTRSVDLYTAKGLLRKVKLPGQSRAAGFLESDLNKLILSLGA